MVGEVEKYVIFNADDFGASEGVNRGIIDCHRNGVVTSTSFMVTGRAARHAVAMSRDNPSLAIGLHFDVWGEDERNFSMKNHREVREEFRCQLNGFHDFFGRLPTHVDSHRHAHPAPRARVRDAGRMGSPPRGRPEGGPEHGPPHREEHGQLAAIRRNRPARV